MSDWKCEIFCYIRFGIFILIMIISFISFVIIIYQLHTNRIRLAKERKEMVELEHRIALTKRMAVDRYKYKTLKMDDLSDDDGDDWEAVDKKEDEILATLLPTEAHSINSTISFEDRPSTSYSEPVEIHITQVLGDASRKVKNERSQSASEAVFRRQLNLLSKERHADVHKTHLLCLIHRSILLSRMCDMQLAQGFLLSHLTVDQLTKPCVKWTVVEFRKFMVWFCDTFRVGDQSSSTDKDLQSIERSLMDASILLNLNKVSNLVITLCFVSLCRAIGFDTRLVVALSPVPLFAAINRRAPPEIVKAVRKLEKGSLAESDVEPAKKRVKSKSSKKQSKSNEKRPARSTANDDVDYEVDNSSCDSDYEKPLRRKARKTLGKRVAHKTTSKSKSLKNKNELVTGEDVWVEVYLSSLKRWVAINCCEKQFDCENKVCPSTISYVLGIDGNDGIRDVILRYRRVNFHKLWTRFRVESDWWNKTLALFPTVYKKRDEREDRDLHELLLELPLPTTQNEFNNNPLYVMDKVITKFKALYPNDIEPLGQLTTRKGDKLFIYPRSAVVTLHSKNKWLQEEARSIIPDVEPFKIVDSQPKPVLPGKKGSEFAMLQRMTAPPKKVALYARWQTEPYKPQPAKDGKVPRNEFGNVYLFRKSMLPPGTAHIPGTYTYVGHAAKKLGIDCVQAIDGWEFHRGGNHPTFNGWVVCKEFKQLLLNAATEEGEVLEDKKYAKRQKRILNNWRRLTRGLLLRDRLRKIMCSDQPAVVKTVSYQPCYDGPVDRCNSPTSEVEEVEDDPVEFDDSDQVPPTRRSSRLANKK